MDGGPAPLGPAWTLWSNSGSGARGTGQPSEVFLAPHTTGAPPG